MFGGLQSERESAWGAHPSLGAAATSTRLSSTIDGWNESYSHQMQCHANIVIFRLLPVERANSVRLHGLAVLSMQVSRQKMEISCMIMVRSIRGCK